MINTNNLAPYIWSLANLLRSDFKQSQYGRVILPFTLLRGTKDLSFFNTSKMDISKLGESGINGHRQDRRSQLGGSP